MLAVAAPAAAAGTIPFRVVAHDIAATRTTLKPFALVATSPNSAHRIVVAVPTHAAQPVLRANYRTSIVVGVFGPFGCKDGRIHVARVTQSGTMLTVHLSLKPLAAGTMECQAIYETVRVLVVPRAPLHRAPIGVTVAGP
ncbi:MAG TPA: hypothetical protein VLJ44_14140 [Gaiellaceae bacterium]|nr:hypothetical protein [Gaiellaceae bacterium]